jgi:hypothetical protein
MVNGISQIPIIVSKGQENKFVMPKTVVVACKFKQELKPLRRRKHFESNQGTRTYQILTLVQNVGAMH